MLEKNKIDSTCGMTSKFVLWPLHACTCKCMQYIQMCTCSQICIYVELWPEDVGAGGDVEGLALDGHSGATKHTISDTELSPLIILCHPRTFFPDCKSTLTCSCVSLFSTLWCVTGHVSCQLWGQRMSTAASLSLNSSRSCWEVIEKKNPPIQEYWILPNATIGKKIISPSL